MGGGLCRSEDNGNSWAQIGSYGAVVSFAINTNGDIFAGTKGGVFRSTEGGGVFRSAQPTVKPTVVEVECVSRATPAAYALSQNYPNPFNPFTTISYDLSGGKIRTLVRGYQQPGHYSVVWDGRDDEGRAVASGAYIYQLEALDRGFVETKRMFLVQ